MPQGNAAFSLMPPPFYMYRMVVAKARAPEESIQDQIDKISDEVVSPTNRYKIEVMPGIYPEVITMKNYVDVVAPYGRVVIQPDTGGFGVKMASYSMLQGVEVDLTTIKATSGATGIVIEAANTNVIVEDVWVTGGTTDNIGISDASTGSTVIIRKCRIDSAETGYKKTGVDGTTWLADCRIKSADNGIDVDVDAGNLNLMDNELMGTGTGANVDVAAGTATINVYSFGNTLNGDGWQIGSNPNAWVHSHNDKFTKVYHAGDGHMVATEEPQTYRVHNGMKIGDALTAIAALPEAEEPTDTRRFTIQVFSGEYNEAVEMAQWVDLVGESNQSCVISQANATVLTCNDNSRVKSVRVELTAGGGGVVGILVDDVDAFLEDIVVRVTAVTGYNYCLHTTDYGGVIAFGLDCYASGDAGYAAAFSGAGTHRVYDSVFESASTSRQDVWVGFATLHSYNNKLMTTGWYISDSALAICLSHGDDYTEVTFEGTPDGANGFFADLTGCRIYDCADTINVGDWVYCDSNDHVALADSDDIAKLPSIGRVVYMPTTTTCYVKNYGYAYDVNANSGHGDPWVAGTEFWIDGGANAGEINDSMPPVWQQMAGVAVSTQRFKIIIGDVLGWAHTNEYLNASGAVAVDDWVYITGTNDTVAKADASAAATMPAIGVVCEEIDLTHCRVKLRGKWSQTHTDGWTASDDAYISETAGEITNIPPVMGVVQKVAEVKSYSDTTLVLEIAD